MNYNGLNQNNGEIKQLKIQKTKSTSTNSLYNEIHQL